MGADSWPAVPVMKSLEGGEVIFAVPPYADSISSSPPASVLSTDPAGKKNRRKVTIVLVTFAQEDWESLADWTSNLRMVGTARQTALNPFEYRLWPKAHELMKQLQPGPLAKWVRGHSTVAEEGYGTGVEALGLILATESKVTLGLIKAQRTMQA